MDGEQRQQAVDIEQNAAELLLRNPYCSNEETHSGCRLPNVMVQPKRITGKQWSLWKTFLVCLLACLIATALVALVLYFVHFGKPTIITTVIIHADRTSNHVTCIPGSTSSPASLFPPGSQSTLPSTLAAHQSSSTTVPRPPWRPLKPQHGAIKLSLKIKNDIFELSLPQARSTPLP